MPDPLSSSAEGGDPNIADARWVLRDTPPPPSPGTKRAPGHRVGEDEHYAVSEMEAPTDLGFPVIRDREGPGLGSDFSRRRPPPRKATREGIDSAEEVREVWTRWAEWKSTLWLLSVALLATIGLVLVALDWQFYVAAACFGIGGALVMLALSYPILVTLERPVRLIPEQALRDYFDALSNHYPHYRRMWLLLSTSGRRTNSFSTFEEFRDYWRARLAELRGGGEHRTNSLKFEATNFDKSTGMNWVDVKYELRIYLKHSHFEAMVGSYSLETSLVRGPDRMWYLTDGRCRPHGSGV